MNARDIRLTSDFESLQTLVEQSLGAFEIESVLGRPPDQYVVVYHCRSIVKLTNGKPEYSGMHRMRVRLPARYPLPSAPPRLDMLTPLYNPHVYANLQVCLGNWQTMEYLDELIARVGALIQLDRRILNLREPANPEAMEWVKKNYLLLPTDTRIFGPQAVEDISPAIPEELTTMEPVQRFEIPQTEMFNEPATEDDVDDMEWIDT